MKADRLLPLLTGASRAFTGRVVEIAHRLSILGETFHMNNTYSLRCTALILLAAGYGWAGGHFIPAGSSPWAYLFQFVILLLLLVFGVGFLMASGAGGDGQRAIGVAGAPKRLRWNTRALTIFAGLTLLINIGNIVQGAIGKSAYGSHNSFDDLVPIGMIIAADVIWLLTVIKKTAAFA